MKQLQVVSLIVLSSSSSSFLLMYTCMKAVSYDSSVLCRLKSAGIGHSGLQMLADALTTNHTLKILRYVEVMFKYVTIASSSSNRGLSC